MLTYFETNLLSSKDVILGLLLKTMLKLKKKSTKTNKKNGIKKKKPPQPAFMVVEEI